MLTTLSIILKMADFQICEIVDGYEPVIDCKNQSFRDLNRIELSEKYKEKTFMCCGTTFTHKKKAYFLHSHIISTKHKKFIAVATQKYKDEYGTFTSAELLVDVLIKQNRDLKVQLHRKSDECQLNNKELVKKEVLLNTFRDEIANLKSKENKRLKKLRLVPMPNLIDL